MFTQSSDHDERGISPVIGVILMIAITVLLAATTAVFVLGFGDQTSATPQAGFSFDYDASGSSGDSLSMKHTAGDTLVTDNVYVIVSGTGDSNVDGRHAFSDLTPSSVGSQISASEKAVVSESQFSSVSSIDLSGATVRVVWQDPEGDNSAELAKWTN